MQKYRFDEAADPDSRGQVALFTRWIGGLTLAGIRNCATPWGPRTVYVTGDADTWFSVPAVCRVRGVRVTGYIGSFDGPDGVSEFAFYAHDDSLRKLAATDWSVVDEAQRLRVETQS